MPARPSPARRYPPPVRALALSLSLIFVPLAGCDLCWPRGGSLGQCVEPANDDDTTDDDDAADDDDSGDDDDSILDDDDTVLDDDDATDDPCLVPRQRPAAFEETDQFGYGYATTDSADAPTWCWFTQEDGVEVQTDNLSSAGASVSHGRIEWDVVWYGVTADVVRIDVNGVIHFDYFPSVNPNNSCIEPIGDLPVVAVYWDNLDMLADGYGDIWHGVVGEAPNRIAVAWWENMRRVSDDGTVDVQFHLHEDGHAEVHYRLVESDVWESDLGRGASIGVLKDSQTSSDPGLWVGCNEASIRDDFSIAYWPPLD